MQLRYLFTTLTMSGWQIDCVLSYSRKSLRSRCPPVEAVSTTYPASSNGIAHHSEEGGEFGGVVYIVHGNGQLSAKKSEFVEG